jgi:transcriptional regulator GlxA family with amidase domain
MQDESRSDAAGESVEQKLDGVGSLVVAEEDGGLSIEELEGFAAGVVLTPSAIEVSDGRAIFTPADPNVFGAELELGQGLVGFHGRDGLGGCLNIQTVDKSGLCGHGVLLFHYHSPLQRVFGAAPALAGVDGCKLGLDTARHQIDFGQERSFRANSWVYRLEKAPKVLEAIIVALPETAGSALYGMVDVLAATGTLWRQLVGDDPVAALIHPRIVSLSSEPFRCGNDIPVTPDLAIEDVSKADILILPELWLAPSDDMRERYAELKNWIRRLYRSGCTVYSACSGSVLLAATGLLKGREATSHWAYADLFRNSFPEVRFNPEPNLVFADPAGRIVTAGGTTSWHDLAIHIISRHCGPGEALRIAKVYLLKLHGEGQLPYAALVRRQPHADSVVRHAETWLAENFRKPHAVAAAVAACGIPERSLKRRFKAATGTTLMSYVQNLRIEDAKRLLESTEKASDNIAVGIGYENTAFFRRLFKRCTGLTPGQYRQMFRPIVRAASTPSAKRKISASSN